MIVNSTIRERVMIKAKPLERVHLGWIFIRESGISGNQIGQLLSIYSVITQSSDKPRHVARGEAKPLADESNEKNRVFVVFWGAYRAQAEGSGSGLPGV
jgi:hypothetical protein